MPLQTCTVGLQWIDLEGGTPITEAIHFALDDVANPTDAAAEVATLIPLLEAVSGCRIVGSHVTFDIPVTVSGAAIAGYMKNTGGRLTFYDSNDVADSIYIPGMLQSQFTNTTRFVDPATTQMVALINKLTGVGGVDPLSQYGSGAKWATYYRGVKANRK